MAVSIGQGMDDGTKSHVFSKEEQKIGYFTT